MRHTFYCQLPECEKEYPAHRSDKKFCSDACRKASSRANIAARKAAKEEKARREAPIRVKIAELEKVNAAIA
ncbi:MAG: hypothetical protein AAF570_04240 [Bacteroidota bacterium]